MSEEPSHGFGSVLCLCGGEVLTMLGVFAFAALLPDFMAEWSLSNTEAGWISGILFAGYTVTVPVLTALTDRVDAKRVWLFGAVVAALSSLGFALLAEGFWSAMAWRALAGVGLAGTYMPGLKALVDRVSGPKQPRWISFYTASFSLGTSASFLASGAIGDGWGWRPAFVVSGLGAGLAAALVWRVLPAVRPIPPAQPVNPFDFLPVFRNRAAMGYVLGYAVHTWELFGSRSWMVAFLAWVQMAQPGAWGPAPTSVATIAGVLAMGASIGGADLAVRWDRRKLCTIAMLGSGVMSCVMGFTSGLPYGAVAVLMLLYTLFVQLDSASLTTGAVLSADPERRGATIAVHSLLGFGGAFLGPLAFGVVLDAAGGGGTGLAWGLGFASLGLVVLTGPMFLRLR